MIERADVVALARSQIGIPFHHGQAVRDVACDCIGLVVIVAAALGLPEAARWKADTRFQGYGRLPLPDKLLEACAEYMDPVPLGSAKPGHVMLFSFKRDPMHFGILSRAEPPYVIHGYQRVGRVVENGLRASFWRPLAAFNLRGVA